MQFLLMFFKIFYISLENTFITDIKYLYFMQILGTLVSSTLKFNVNIFPNENLVIYPIHLIDFFLNFLLITEM
jgi:hypothetical protein